MRRKRTAVTYSNEFAVLVVIFGVTLFLSNNLILALVVAAVALIAYMAWLISKELQRRKAFADWFHNHRGMDNLDDMTPLQFEVFVAELFSELGYNTQLTPRSGDEGIDVLAKKDDKMYAIQVKKTAKPVGSPVIQTLFGSMAHIHADYGMCVSSSGFTSEAKRFAFGKQITLLNKDDLANLLKQVK